MRRGVTLVELLVIALPALVILALLFHLLVRTAAADRWQDARLAGLDAVLIASEHLRHDLASCRAGDVDVAPGRLAIVKGESLRATYSSGSAFRRDGRRLAAAPLAAAEWTWRDEPAGLLHLRLAADAGGRVTLATQVLVPDRAARLEFGEWVP